VAHEFSTREVYFGDTEFFNKLLDLATKAEWLLFAQIPLGVDLFRLPKLTPEEWITRFGKLLGNHVLTLLNGSQYLVTTNLNGSTTAQAMVVSKDLDKFS
jgi:hypothetical protein